MPGCRQAWLPSAHASLQTHGEPLVAARPCQAGWRIIIRLVDGEIPLVGKLFLFYGCCLVIIDWLLDVH